MEQDINNLKQVVVELAKMVLKQEYEIKRRQCKNDDDLETLDEQYRHSNFIQTLEEELHK